jgi:cation diffusion facilitator family transporter
MKSCCESKCDELALIRDKQKKVLLIVLIINAVMFFVEFTFGVLSKSTSLLADSLDMLGDASVYAFSLYVLNRSLKWKAGAALLKGIIINLFGIYVLIEALLKIISDVTPVAHTMGVIGLIALIANAICLFLLLSHKDDDINMKSTWICSRNDIIANTGVLIAAFCVSYFQSKWPDILMGVFIAIVFLRSSIFILKDSIKEIRL